MLIRNAEIDFMHGSPRRVDVRIAGPSIAALAEHLPVQAGEALIDARGAALLPGLHDHHLHLVSLAVALDSLECGPPQVTTAAQLAAALQARAAIPAPVTPGDDWLRGIGYHESVAGDIDRAWLDRVVADRPVRIQQRSGRLWIVNSCGLDRLLADGASLPPGLECRAGAPTGRIFDADPWLRSRLPRAFPRLDRVGRLLASFGVTGVTDTTPHNDPAQFRHFVAARRNGELVQQLLIMGDASLDALGAANIEAPGVARGATKFHLHEIELPLFDDFCAAIRRSHAAGRPVAVHCVTLTELVFAATALTECSALDGRYHGDRIEHAALAPPEVLALLVEQGLTVVTQPNFIHQRGDAYLQDVPTADQLWLYRLRGLRDAGIALAGSTDAPFGAPDPWRAMQAAVDRRTAGGATIGRAEALTPEAALVLYLSPLDAPGGPARRVAVGTSADLCLLDRSWAQARENLSAVRVAATFKDGVRIWPH